MGFKKSVIIPIGCYEMYGHALEDDLKKAGYNVAVLEVPDGEEYKSLEQAGKLYLQLNDFQTERMTPVLALGGGVIGDLAGFVAATYMRGVPLFHIPTTLLSQVDSSIGGKVAVNHSRMKNNIGTFFQPKLVLADLNTLKTLPEKELVNGMAEVIKYGVIRDPDLFNLLETNIERIKSLDMELVEEVVARCAGIKAAVVETDEKDMGLRNILNYGHTIGHTVETVSGFRIHHGSGVGIGMVAAGMISQKMGILPLEDLKRINDLVMKAGLPVRIPGLDIPAMLKAMQHDKKKLEDKVRFILPKTIGEVFISDEVSASTLNEVLESINA
jgi:3-dehydroquinate synthase